MMLSTANLLSPADGSPVVAPTQDMVLGCYYLTMDAQTGQVETSPSSLRDRGRGDPRLELGAYLELATARRRGATLHDGASTLEVDVVGRGTPRPLAPGAPTDDHRSGASSTRSCRTPLRFHDKVMKRSDLKELVDRCYRELGAEETAHLVDGIKSVGFEFATRGGMTIGLFDIEIPKDKAARLDAADEAVAAIDGSSSAASSPRTSATSRSSASGRTPRRDVRTR